MIPGKSKPHAPSETVNIAGSALIFLFWLALFVSGEPLQVDEKSNSILYKKQKTALFLAELGCLKVRIIENEDVVLNRKLPFGSMIKPFTLYYALRKGKIDESKVLYCEPSLPTDPAYSRCWYTPGHGRLNCVRALAVSCNRFFYKLSKRLAYKDYITFLSDFGFDVSNISRVKDPLKRLKVMIGLEDLLTETPASLAFRLAAFFEGGIIYKLNKAEKISLQKIIPLNEEYAGIIRKGMRLGDIDGTSAPEIPEKLLNLNLWSKTGTIGYNKYLNKTTEEQNNGLYFAYFIAGNRRYVLLVILPGGKGSDAAKVGRELILKFSEPD